MKYIVIGQRNGWKWIRGKESDSLADAMRLQRSCIERKGVTYSIYMKMESGNALP